MVGIKPSLNTAHSVPRSPLGGANARAPVDQQGPTAGAQAPAARDNNYGKSSFTQGAEAYQKLSALQQGFVEPLNLATAQWAQSQVMGQAACNPAYANAVAMNSQGVGLQMQAMAAGISSEDFMKAGQLMGAVALMTGNLGLFMQVQQGLAAFAAAEHLMPQYQQAVAMTPAYQRPADAQVDPAKAQGLSAIHGAVSQAAAKVDNAADPPAAGSTASAASPPSAGNAPRPRPGSAPAKPAAQKADAQPPPVPPRPGAASASAKPQPPPVPPRPGPASAKADAQPPPVPPRPGAASASAKPQPPPVPPRAGRPNPAGASAPPPPPKASASPTKTNASAPPPPPKPSASPTKTNASAPPPPPRPSAPPPKAHASAPPPKASASAPPPKASASAPPPKASASAPPPKASASAPPPKASASAAPKANVASNAAQLAELEAKFGLNFQNDIVRDDKLTTPAGRAELRGALSDFFNLPKDTPPEGLAGAVRSKYRRLVLECHPDKVKADDPQKDLKNMRFTLGASAYKMVEDPDLRKQLMAP